MVGVECENNQQKDLVEDTFVRFEADKVRTTSV